MWKQLVRDKVILSIRSKQNPTIQSLIRLRDKRVLRDEKQVFLVEGYRELRRISPYISTSTSTQVTSSQNEVIEPPSSQVRRFTINELYYCMSLFKSAWRYLYILIFTLIHIHTYVHTLTFSYLHPFIHPSIHTYIHT